MRLTTQQLAKSKHARSSFVGLSVEMSWLLPKFEKFRPSVWYAGVCLLVLRLLQTSFVALFNTQRDQAAIVSLLSLLAACCLREIAPMRNPSDNQVAVLSQMLVFLWAWFLLLRLTGMFQSSVAAVFMGVALCIVTAAVFLTALVLANSDRLRNQEHRGSMEEAATDDDDRPLEAFTNESTETPVPSSTDDGIVSVEIIDVATTVPRDEEDEKEESREKEDPDWLGRIGSVVCSL